MKQHPHEALVHDMANSGRIIDVTELASCMSSFSRDIFKDKKTWRAYRVVAADVLMTMVRQGRLVQHGAFGKNPEDGGPHFTVKGVVE